MYRAKVQIEEAFYCRIGVFEAILEADLVDKQHFGRVRKGLRISSPQNIQKINKYIHL